MKYKTPELTALTTAINAIQSPMSKLPPTSGDSGYDVEYEGVGRTKTGSKQPRHGPLRCSCEPTSAILPMLAAI